MTLGERLAQAGLASASGELAATAQACAERLRLPFSRRNWRGQGGNWAGAGIGSSIDFQDHRPYVPGDDPRYINWQAYARSGNYTMKLYREEVRPVVDVVLDLSESMFVQPSKAARTLELFHFACHSAWRNGAQLRTSLLRGGLVHAIQPQALNDETWQLPPAEERAATAPAQTHAPQWQSLMLGSQSMRVVISDFLFEQEPGEALGHLVRGGGQAVLFCVYTREEMRPQWLGNLELLDCEDGRRLRRHFTREDVEEYHRRYDGHFAAWADAALRQHAVFSRIDAAPTLADALLGASGPQGGAELCN